MRQSSDHGLRPARAGGTVIALGLMTLLALAVAGCGGTPAASATEPAATPTAGEATLLAGMRLDLEGSCRPLRSGLPATALAGLECVPADAAIGAARVYLFNRGSEMLAAYVAILDDEGIALRVDLSSLSTSEGPYWPGPDTPAEPSEARNARWLDDTGHGHYLATALPFVLLDVTGTDANVDALYRWTWRGNQDVPGGPTLWRESGPTDPNGKG
jgi:hypothetical protein